MAPRPRSFMRAATARAVTNVPVRLTRSTWSHSARSMSRARARGKIPALLTRPSGLPQSRSKSATAASIASVLPTSRVKARDVAPFSRQSFAVSSTPSRCTSQTARCTPWAASRNATARPMPCAAPVTIILCGDAIRNPVLCLSRGHGGVVAQERAAISYHRIDRQPLIGRPHFRREGKHDLGAEVALQHVDRRRRIPAAAVDVNGVDPWLHRLEAGLAVLIDLHVRDFVERHQRGRIERIRLARHAQAADHHTLDVETAEVAL